VETERVFARFDGPRSQTLLRKMTIALRERDKCGGPDITPAPPETPVPGLPLPHKETVASPMLVAKPRTPVAACARYQLSGSPPDHTYPDLVAVEYVLNFAFQPMPLEPILWSRTFTNLVNIKWKRFLHLIPVLAPWIKCADAHEFSNRDVSVAIPWLQLLSSTADHETEKGVGDQDAPKPNQRRPTRPRLSPPANFYPPWITIRKSVSCCGRRAVRLAGAAGVYAAPVRRMDASCVEGGRPALALMSKQPFDVVITDMRMPDMNGTELLNEVMKRYPKPCGLCCRVTRTNRPCRKA